MTVQLNTTREPSKATGGKGSEVTLVFSGGTRSQWMIWKERKRSCLVSGNMTHASCTRLRLLLTDDAQLDTVADRGVPPSRSFAVI